MRVVGGGRREDGDIEETGGRRREAVTCEATYSPLRLETITCNPRRRSFKGS